MDHTLLAPARVRPASGLPQFLHEGDSAALDADDSAYRAMTDFQREYPITVPADRSLEDALNDMIRLGVHALLVTKQEIDGGEQRVAGLVTAYEIHHQRSHLLHSADEPNQAEKGSVGDVMTSWDELSLVKYESLQTLTALDLYEMFQGTGLTHLLVIEGHGNDAAQARGLISRASLARRLRL